MKPKRKYSRFQLAEPDCKGRIGSIVVTVFNLSSQRPRIVYATANVPSEIKTAVKMWIKYLKFGGLSLTEYLTTMFDANNYNEDQK